MRGAPRRPVLLTPLVVAAVIQLFASCRPTEHPLEIDFIDLEGSWRYRASEVRAGEVVCTIEGINLSIVQVNDGGDFSGSATPGEMKCADAAGSYAVPLQTYPIRNGYTFAEYVSFDLYNGGWRHEGLVVSPDSLAGTFTLLAGSVEFTGRFGAARVRP